MGNSLLDQIPVTMGIIYLPPSGLSREILQEILQEVFGRDLKVPQSAMYR